MRTRTTRALGFGMADLERIVLPRIARDFFVLRRGADTDAASDDE